TFNHKGHKVHKGQINQSGVGSQHLIQGHEILRAIPLCSNLASLAEKKATPPGVEAFSFATCPMKSLSHEISAISSGSSHFIGEPRQREKLLSCSSLPSCPSLLRGSTFFFLLTAKS
ncbi:MAG: hypothetical protein K9J81_00885, partial [Desulfohalobiaceae bacterium]|nr:hypothetical protein [Desulfohalobiaceae bacterium]